MSGDPDSGDGDAPRPRVSLFGRARKPTLNDPAPPPAKLPRKPRRMGLSSLSGLLTFVLLGALATVGALAWLMKEARNPGPLTEDKVVMITREDDAAGIADYRKSWLFRACRGHNPMILCQGEPLWTATSSIQIWMTPL